nr:MAG TPA: hypothetical protein [Caudoviricetes sp.]
MTRGFNPSRVSNNATVASFQYSYSHITISEQLHYFSYGAFDFLGAIHNPSSAAYERLLFRHLYSRLTTQRLSTPATSTFAVQHFLCCQLNRRYTSYRL